MNTIKLLVFTGIAVMTQSAFADATNKPECDRGKGHKEHLAQKLGLNESQKKQLDQIHQKYQTQRQSKHQQLMSAREDLAKSVKAPQKGKAYQSTLFAKFKNVQKLKNELRTSRFQMALEVREMLNEEQLSKFEGFRGRKHGFRRMHKAPLS